jgi:excisionase family DNA binding protein
MPDPLLDLNSGRSSDMAADRLSSRISVPEIAQRLEIGRLAVYATLEQGTMPGIRLGRRWIITRRAYEQWELTCGMRTGLHARPEVTVLN